MKKAPLYIFLLLPLIASAGSFSISSPGKAPLEIDVPKTSGLNALYVLDGVQGAVATYTSDSPSADVVWQRYSALGGGYAEQVNGITHNGNQWTLSAVEGDMGYIIEEGDQRFYVWITDYSRHTLLLDGLAVVGNDDCDYTQLILTGKAEPIHYYSIAGRQLVLSRELELSYNTLEWSDDANAYTTVRSADTFEYIEGSTQVQSPLCQTEFTLTGDRFLKTWGEEQAISTATIDPHAVSAHTMAEQLNEKADNQSGADDGLGGSAPAQIQFSAITTDAAIFNEWQFSTYPDFDDIQLRVNEQDYTHTFDEQGTTYVRFVCDNASGTCQFVGQTYQINIGESSLLCPNAFSPGASEGVNDEWRVSYRSIVSFECSIFNRNGQKMCTLTDPSMGWDGKHGGKVVPAGVYYYVIKARGADGKKYNLSGDINIVNYK